MELWTECKIGIGSRQPDVSFNSRERNDAIVKVNQKYCRRKVVLFCVDRLVRQGFAADAARTKIRTVHVVDKITPIGAHNGICKCLQQ